MLHIRAEVENGDQIEKTEDQNDQLSGDETEGDHEAGLLQLGGYGVDRVQEPYISPEYWHQACRYCQQHQSRFPQLLFSFDVNLSYYGQAEVVSDHGPKQHEKGGHLGQPLFVRESRRCSSR